MNCPYCDMVMIKGEIVTACNITPYWREEGTKRNILDALGGKGNLAISPSGDLTHRCIRGFYCPNCKKIIIDAELQA